MIDDDDELQFIFSPPHQEVSYSLILGRGCHGKWCCVCVLSSLFAASRRWSWVWGELRSNEIDESSSAKVSKIDPGGGG